MKECFSCQTNAPYTLRNSLEIYKRLYETTGVVYWFFREEANGKVKIADNESFNKILPTIKDNLGAEWCHIAEFGNSTNEDFSTNTPNAKPKTAKPKSKQRRTKKPLE